MFNLEICCHRGPQRLHFPSFPLISEDVMSSSNTKIPENIICVYCQGFVFLKKVILGQFHIPLNSG